MQSRIAAMLLEHTKWNETEDNNKKEINNLSVVYYKSKHEWIEGTLKISSKIKGSKSERFFHRWEVTTKTSAVIW